VRGDHKVRPVVEAILMHPGFYRGPRMVKPPVVYLAGLLRGMKRGLDTESWTWISEMMRQRLFVPPNVAGWEDDRWLDTGTWRARWIASTNAVRERELKVDQNAPYTPEDPGIAVQRAIDFWGGPAVSAATRARLVAFAQRCDLGANSSWKRRSYPVLRQNALRLLVATSPDLQTS
jgi:hypothetical protein